MEQAAFNPANVVPGIGFSPDRMLQGPLDGDYGSASHYEPNSNGAWQEQPQYAEPPLALEGAADRWDYRADDDDYFTQPGLLFGLMDAAKREALFGNTARALGDAAEEVKIRHIVNCAKADPDYGEGVAAALGIPMSRIGS